ncbi:hypothetical protein GCM10028798_16290 [Humibacter antri]
MRRRNAVIGGVLATAALTGAGLVAALPAYASWGCNSGQLCVYVDSYGNSAETGFYYDNDDWGSFDNVASSLWNDGTSENVSVYVQDNATGSNFTVYRGVSNRHTDLYWDSTGGVSAGYWNDNLMSNHWHA